MSLAGIKNIALLTFSHAPSHSARHPATFRTPCDAQVACRAEALAKAENANAATHAKKTSLATNLLLNGMIATLSS